MPSRLVSNGRLESGAWNNALDRPTSSGTAQLILQEDGNLVLYLLSWDGKRRALWATGTASARGAYGLWMQPRGNLVLYDRLDGRVLWSSGTNGNPGSYLDLQSDLNVVIYKPHVAIWASDTVTGPSGRVIPPPPPSRGNHLGPGDTILMGQVLVSNNGRFRLWLQDDGNLVLYDIDVAIWASDTYGEDSAFLSMQPDGNLVLYRSDHTAAWASGTDGSIGATFDLQDDGNAVIYSRVAIWDR